MLQNGTTSRVATHVPKARGESAPPLRELGGTAGFRVGLQEALLPAERRDDADGAERLRGERRGAGIGGGGGLLAGLDGLCEQSAREACAGGGLWRNDSGCTNDRVTGSPDAQALRGTNRFKLRTERAHRGEGGAT